PARRALPFPYTTLFRSRRLRTKRCKQRRRGSSRRGGEGRVLSTGSARSNASAPPATSDSFGSSPERTCRRSGDQRAEGLRASERGDRGLLRDMRPPGAVSPRSSRAMPRAAWSSRARGLSGASAHGLYGGWRVGGQRGILGRQLHEGLALGVPLEELDLPQIVEPRVDLELAALVLLAHQGIAQEVVDL